MALLDIIFPRRCVNCKKSLDNSSLEVLCSNCLELIEPNIAPFCIKCGRHLKLELKDTHREICRECKNKELHFNRAFSACNYNDQMKNILHLFKYFNKTSLKKPLGVLLVNFIREFGMSLQEYDLAIPMPLHPTRLREREYNQSELLADEVSRALPLKIYRNNVQRKKNTKPQSLLGARERWENIKGAFGVKDPKEISKKNILVIDDLYTTGATVSELALTLKGSGAKKVDILTLAIAQ